MIKNHRTVSRLAGALFTVPSRFYCSALEIVVTPEITGSYSGLSLEPRKPHPLKTLWRLVRFLGHEEPVGYQLKEPRQKPNLEQFLPIIHEVLQQDQKAPKKQRHTAQRIFDRLQGEHHYDGGLTIVKDAVRAWKQRQAEVFVPLAHRPGEAQVDFGEAQVRLRDEQLKVAMFVMMLPYSDAIFCQVFPRIAKYQATKETHETRFWCVKREFGPS